MKKLLSNFMQFLRTHHWTDWVFVAGGLGLLSAVVLPVISKASIWFDEGFSLYITRFNFADILRYTAVDVHPPLYYWFLKIWEIPFGTSELAVRSLSLFFAGVAMVFGFLLVRRLFGRKAAVISLLFIALSPMIVRYSEEARMYTLAAVFVLAATYVLTFAINTKSRKVWLVYGLLVGLGMWTHYFTALAWLAHWAWRFIVIRQDGARGTLLIKKFFSREWIFTYVIAVATFFPWLPIMAVQLGAVQGGGFWIGDVGADTVTNYFTNIFYYLEHSKTGPWLGIILVAVMTGLVVTATRVYKGFNKTQRQNYLLLVCLALIPVALLFLASLPPARSSFVERYLMPSVFAAMLLLAVTVVYGFAKKRFAVKIVPIIIVVGLFAVGISNVYYYGNFNKNRNIANEARQLVGMIDENSQPGEPIISNSPYMFYEVIPYATAEHPVYFLDADTKYEFGSLAMLQDNDQYKIKDLDAFLKEHPVIWYVGQTDDAQINAHDSSWQAIRTISAKSPIDDRGYYKGTEYTKN